MSLCLSAPVAVRPASAAAAAPRRVQARAAKQMGGVVVSTSGNKTASVSVSRSLAHPVYKKRFTRSRKFAVHDENNEAQVGDVVTFAPCRPMSKTKTHTLTGFVSKKGGDKVRSAARAHAARQAHARACGTARAAPRAQGASVAAPPPHLVRDRVGGGHGKGGARAITRRVRRIRREGFGHARAPAKKKEGWGAAASRARRGAPARPAVVRAGFPPPLRAVFARPASRPLVLAFPLSLSLSLSARPLSPLADPWPALS